MNKSYNEVISVIYIKYITIFICDQACDDRAYLHTKFYLFITFNLL